MLKIQQIILEKVWTNSFLPTSDQTSLLATEERGLDFWRGIYCNAIEPGMALVYELESKRHGIKIEPKLASPGGRAKSYEIIQKTMPLVWKKDLSPEEVEHNRSILENPAINTWKHDFTPFASNVWFTNTADFSKARDIIIPNHPGGINNIHSQRELLYTGGAIDAPDSIYRESIANLDAGFKNGGQPLMHIIWTNLDVDTFPFPEKIPNLRKVCGFEPAVLPKYIVINCRTGRIVNEAFLKQNGITVPDILKNHIPSVMQYLDSVKIDDIACYAAASDLVRCIATAIGGIYFDFDYAFYDQLRLHQIGRLNLCDLAKNYNTVLPLMSNLEGKAIAHNDLMLFNLATPMNKVISSLLHFNFNDNIENYLQEMEAECRTLFYSGPAALSVAIALWDSLQDETLAEYENSQCNFPKSTIDLAEVFLMKRSTLQTNDVTLPAPILFDVPWLSTPGSTDLDGFFSPIGFGICIQCWS